MLSVLKADRSVDALSIIGINQRTEPFNESCKVDNTKAVVEKNHSRVAGAGTAARETRLDRTGLTQDKIGNTGDSDLTRVEDPEQNGCCKRYRAKSNEAEATACETNDDALLTSTWCSCEIQRTGAAGSDKREIKSQDVKNTRRGGDSRKMARLLGGDAGKERRRWKD